MPVTVTPYIPQTITVHTGPASQWAENVTVSFPDYIKNVASSEIYPTWPEAALRANILAQISFALNRVYTEYYPSRGYDFDITASTMNDQKFIKGRSTFENVDKLVDELFTTYIRRTGFVEPLSARFCNGTTVTCAVITILTVSEKDYIVLLPLDESGENTEGEVWFYRYSENPKDPSEEPELGYIEDDEEYEAVADAFDEFLDAAEFDEIMD